MTVTRSRALSRILAIVAVFAALAIGLAVIGRWRAAREEREVAALKAKLESGGGDADEHHRLGLILAAGNDGAKALGHFEIAAERSPDNLRYGNDVRSSCVRFKQYDRAIRFFERLVEANPGLPDPQLQLALAYVDKMPDNMMGIVGQSRLSNLSISRLERLLEGESAIRNGETRWAALYALGLNHLYWPKALRHAPRAIEAFRRCLEFQKTMVLKTATPPAHFVLPYVGLGDALVKDARHDEARTVWREAKGLFPAERRLDERLAIALDPALTKYIDKARGLGIAVDTDLSILWGRAP